MYNNNETVREIAIRVISRVLEESAFIFTEELDGGDRPSLDTWDAIGVSLVFKGKPGGTVHMWAGNTFACYAAANMLGVDQEDCCVNEKGIDALKEALNMVVGNFITEAFGEEQVFDLALPQKIEQPLLHSDYNNENAIWLEAETEPILFVVTLYDE